MEFKPLIWKKLVTGNSNHVLRGKTIQHAVCGASPKWYQPDNNGWTDEDLSVMDCIRCLNGLDEDDRDELTANRRVLHAAKRKRRVKPPKTNPGSTDLRVRNGAPVRFRGFGSDLRRGSEGN